MSWWTWVDWTERRHFAADDICGVVGVGAGGRICAEGTYLGHKAILMFTGLVQVLLQLRVALEEDFHSE